MDKIRSFISVKIPDTPAVLGAMEKLRGIKGVSVPKDVHMTVRFLGDVESRKIKDLSERMRPLEEYSPFSVSMKGLGAFPNVRDPRVVWIGAEIGDPFRDILEDIDGMLKASRIDYDKKPFKAHMTIGRVKAPSEHLTGLLNDCREMEIGSFVCSEIFLMKSELTPKGAVHSVIDAFSLAGKTDADTS